MDGENFKRFKFGKLIRDKLPEIMKGQGMVLHNTTLSEDEFVNRLKEKIVEESQEVLETCSTEDLTGELADVVEVVYALAKASQISLEEIDQKRREKKDAKGGFEDRVFTDFVDVEESNPYIRLLEEYPEISSEKTIV